MTDDLRDTTTIEAIAGDWAKVKLPPRLTGLPMAVWITENEGYPHDVRVKVSTLDDGRDSWRTAPSIAVRPQPHEIVPGSLPAADVVLVGRWIDLNRDVIIDYWNGMIDFDEVQASAATGTAVNGLDLRIAIAVPIAFAAAAAATRSW